MPDYDPAAAYEALAPLHWDAEEFDFGIASEDNEPQTEGEDLRLLFQEEPESSSEEGFSWDGTDSSLEEEIGSPSSDDEPTGEKPFRFLGSSEEDSEEESSGGGSWSSNAETDGGSSAFDGPATTTTTTATAEMRRPEAPSAVGTRYLRAVDVGSSCRCSIVKPKEFPFVKSAFPVKNQLLMKLVIF